MSTIDPPAAPASTPWSAAIEQRFPLHADMMRRYVVMHRGRCHRLSLISRLWFRTTGVAVILLSVTLPIVTTTQFSGKEATVTGLSLAIAGLSSLRGFFQWDQSWRLYRQQQSMLTGVLARWESAMVELVHSATPESDARADTVTREALQQAQELGQIEFDTFFTTLAWPDRST